jgi:anti-sigma factor RsiW
MNHEEAQSLLDAYVDEEFSLSDVLRLEPHLRDCASCRAELEERRALIARIRAAPLRHHLPPDLERLLHRQAANRRTVTGRAWWTQALAAGVVMGLLGVWVGHAIPQRQESGDEWVNAYVRSNLSARAVDVVSSSHHTVRPWLSSKLPFSPPVPELNDQGDTLIGARADYIDRMPVAALRYQHGNHQIDVFVWPSVQASTPRVSGATIRGFRVVTTQVVGFNAAIVSDLSPRELDAFRERWRAQAALQ